MNGLMVAHTVLVNTVLLLNRIKNNFKKLKWIIPHNPLLPGADRDVIRYKLVRNSPPTPPKVFFMFLIIFDIENDVF
jgi:hypothetical protein